MKTKMSDGHFKCGCEAGYRDVVTGDLKGYAVGAQGVVLEISMDPCGSMYLGCDRDEAWAKANRGKHLAVTITQFANQGPQVIDIGILDGRTSDLARKAARVGMLLGNRVVKAAEGQWHMHVGEGSIPLGHPILEWLDGREVIPLTDDLLDGLDSKLQ